MQTYVELRPRNEESKRQEKPRAVTAARLPGGQSYRPDDNDCGVCGSSGHQCCAGVSRPPRVRESANAKWGAPLRRSPRQTLYCARCWSTIRTSGLILARLGAELRKRKDD